MQFDDSSDVLVPRCHRRMLENLPKMNGGLSRGAIVFPLLFFISETLFHVTHKSSIIIVIDRPKTASEAKRSTKLRHPFTFGACVMARDDNLYLPEWIAYHYTIMPMRSFVIAIDPLSWTTPIPIIEQFQNALPDLNITIWTGNWYFEDGRWSREKMTHLIH